MCRSNENQNNKTQYAVFRKLLVWYKLEQAGVKLDESDQPIMSLQNANLLLHGESKSSIERLQHGLQQLLRRGPLLVICTHHKQKHHIALCSRGCQVVCACQREWCLQCIPVILHPSCPKYKKMLVSMRDNNATRLYKSKSYSLTISSLFPLSTRVALNLLINIQILENFKVWGES